MARRHLPDAHPTVDEGGPTPIHEQLAPSVRSRLHLVLSIEFAKHAERFRAPFRELPKGVSQGDGRLRLVQSAHMRRFALAAPIGLGLCLLLCGVASCGDGFNLLGTPMPNEQNCQYVPDLESCKLTADKHHRYVPSRLRDEPVQECQDRLHGGDEATM